MTATSESRSTWRTDRHSQCPRADAGAWLSFLAQAGYPLSPIEKAVASGVPYQGDAADAELPAAGDAGAAEDDGGPGENQSLALADAPAGGDGLDAARPLAA